LIKSKIAQLRVYPTALNEAQLLRIQARSVWNLEQQDPVSNRLSTRISNATFVEATAACEVLGKTLVTAPSREAEQDLLERAGADLQSLTWVGATQDAGTGKWKWQNASIEYMSEAQFYHDFTCHYNATGITLVDAQKQCQNEGRILKLPRNEDFATLARVQKSCPEFATGCRFCNNPSKDIIALYQCTAAGEGLQTLGQVINGVVQFGFASEDECVVASGVWQAFTLAELQGSYAEHVGLPGLMCATLLSPYFSQDSVDAGTCLSQRHILRMDMARDITAECPQGFEAQIDTNMGGTDDLYVYYKCCRPSPTCSEPQLALHYTYFCQAASDYNANQDNLCLAVLKFRGELRYITKKCTEPLSYICQDAASPPVLAELDVVGDMKECFDECELESDLFADSIEQDVQGNTCSWYAAMKLTHPRVCDSSAAKKMCGGEFIMIVFSAYVVHCKMCLCFRSHLFRIVCRLQKGSSSRCEIQSYKLLYSDILCLYHACDLRWAQTLFQ